MILRRVKRLRLSVSSLTRNEALKDFRCTTSKRGYCETLTANAFQQRSLCYETSFNFVPSMSTDWAVYRPSDFTHCQTEATFSYSH